MAFLKHPRLLRLAVKSLAAGGAGVMLVALAGCGEEVGAGYGDGYYGPAYYGYDYYGPGYFDDYGPDVYIFGDHDREHWDHHRDFDYGHRGFESRGGGRPEGHDYRGSRVGGGHGGGHSDGEHGGHGGEHH